MALQLIDIGSSPKGPGFFIFFRTPKHDTSRQRQIDLPTKTNRIKEDDEEVLLLMSIIHGNQN